MSSQKWGKSVSPPSRGRLSGGREETISTFSTPSHLLASYYKIWYYLKTPNQFKERRENECSGIFTMNIAEILARKLRLETTRVEVIDVPVSQEVLNHSAGDVLSHPPKFPNFILEKSRSVAMSDEPRISRVVPIDDISWFAATAISIYSIPREFSRRVDAIVSFPGLGELSRIIEPIALWESGESRARHLLIAGINLDEKTAEPYSLQKLQLPPFNLTKLEGVHSAVHAEHTKHQADWLTHKVEGLRIESVALFAPAYHIFRAYLTVLQSFITAGMSIPIIPCPTTVAPFQRVPEVGIEAWDMIHGEVARIKEYQKKGDVAFWEELQQYLLMLWEHPIMKLQ
jgi:hypothetical protein